MLARLHLPRGTKFYEDALEGLVRVNADLYRDNPRLPSIYAARVRYKGFDPDEDWQNVVEVIRAGSGDCEDLAAARAGELRARGDARARAIVRRTGPRMTHGLVMHGNGTIEDPSRKLGMGREQIGGMEMSRYPGYDEIGATRRVVARKPLAPIRVRARAALSPATAAAVSQLSPAGRAALAARLSPAARAAMATVPSSAPEDDATDPNEEPNDGSYAAPFDPYSDDSPDLDTSGPDEFPDSDDFEEIGADVSQSAELSWAVNRTPSGWQGVVRVPLNAGRALMVARTAATKDDAARKSLSAASNVLDSDLAKMLIPPQAQMALNVIRSPKAQKAAKIAIEAAKKLKFW